MSNCKVYIADKIFTGEEWLTGHAIVIDGEIIKEVISQKDIPSGVTVNHFGSSIIAPAFID